MGGWGLDQPRAPARPGHPARIGEHWQCDGRRGPAGWACRWGFVWGPGPGPTQTSILGFETATDIPNNNSNLKTAAAARRVTRPGEWPVTEKGASRSRADPVFHRLARHPTKRELGTGQTRNRRAFTF